jgi:hypothetical protein
VPQRYGLLASIINSHTTTDKENVCRVQSIRYSPKDQGKDENEIKPITPLTPRPSMLAPKVVTLLSLTHVNLLKHQKKKKKKYSSHARVPSSSTQSAYDINQ